MTTYDEAIQHAGRALAEGFRRLQEGTPREAAERAYTPGGPSVEQLEARIVSWRRVISVKERRVSKQVRRLLSDDEVAEQIGCSKSRLQADRALDRGDGGDRVPKWIQAGNSWRPRTRGTRQSAVNEWLDRHEEGRISGNEGTPS